MKALDNTDPITRVLRKLAFMMFKQTNKDSKFRGLLMWGAPNSGKTSIADYVRKIFTSALLALPVNNFTEDIKKEDTFKQIVYFDDVNLPGLF